MGLTPKNLTHEIHRFPVCIGADKSLTLYFKGSERDMSRQPDKKVESMRLRGYSTLSQPFLLILPNHVNMKPRKITTTAGTTTLLLMEGLLLDTRTTSTNQPQITRAGPDSPTGNCPVPRSVSALIKEPCPSLRSVFANCPAGPI